MEFEKMHRTIYNEPMLVDVQLGSSENSRLEKFSPNSQRSYDSSIAHFLKSGKSLPASENTILLYLMDYVGILSVATLSVRLWALGHWHVENGYPNPTRSSEMKSIFLPLIRQAYGRVVSEPAQCFTATQIAILVDTFICHVNPISVRNTAMILICFVGRLNRDHLTALQFEDIGWLHDGVNLSIIVKRGFGTSDGVGQRVIRRTRGRYCAVAALDRWLQTGHIDCGPVFRPIDRWGNVSESALSVGGVNTILKMASMLAHGANARAPMSKQLRAPDDRPPEQDSGAEHFPENANSADWKPVLRRW